MIDESNFESYRQAFRLFENAAKRLTAANNRHNRLDDSLSSMLDRGICNEDEILTAANLINRKRKAVEVTYECMRMQNAIQDKVMGRRS